MVKNFYIVFDRASPAPVFSRGDVVSGRVVLELSAASRVQCLTAHTQGLAKVHFKMDAEGLANKVSRRRVSLSDAMSFYAKHQTAEVEFLNQREVLLCAGKTQ